MISLAQLKYGNAAEARYRSFALAGFLQGARSNSQHLGQLARVQDDGILCSLSRNGSRQQRSLFPGGNFAASIELVLVGYSSQHGSILGTQQASDTDMANARVRPASWKELRGQHG